MKKTVFIVLLSLLAIPAFAQDKVVPQNTAQMQLTFSPIVKQVTPGVVNIYTQQVVQQQMMPFMIDPMFQQFFGGMGQAQQRLENSLGSGVIVRNDGLIVTNAHVAKNSVKIKVVLSDRREFPAKVVLTDDKADLALLKIDSDKKDFPALKFADSETLEVGDLVLAIGNPFGVGQTVTSGIVSGLARTNIGKGGGYYIQTDAAINPGNSGGALVNMNGEVVGINSVILSKTGGYMGIGFAAPANLVKTVIATYESGGTIQRASLGASLQTVTSDIADSIGLDRPQGVMIQKVYDKGAAHEAGLQRGDVIIDIDGKETDNAETIRYILATKTLGQSVPLTYIRKGRQEKTTIKVAPSTDKTISEKIEGNNPLGGAELSEINPTLADELDNPALPEDGVVVTSVSGPSRQLGLRPGDVVVGVNGKMVQTIKDVKEALAKPAGNVWQINLQRKGQGLTAIMRR